MKIELKHYFVLIVICLFVLGGIFFINKGSLSIEELDKVDESYFLNPILKAEDIKEFEIIYE